MIGDRKMNAIAGFTEVTDGTLLERNGASFYRLTPVKGARVEGTVSVSVTSHDVTIPGSNSWEPKRTVPGMWVDYTPSFKDKAGRKLLTVNGREYGAGFGESVSGRVEFMPANSYKYLSKYGHPTAIIDGVTYYVRATVNQFDSVTDKAREVLNDVAELIATEFVTDARWHAYRVSQAEYAVGRAIEDRDKAQAKLDAARAVLDSLI
jgi:hypothetical protein